MSAADWSDGGLAVQVARECLEAGLDHVRDAPRDSGRLELIVRRPAPSERDLPDAARRRFGADAMKFVNSATGRELRLRGLNTRVITPGTIARGDQVRVVRV